MQLFMQRLYIVRTEGCLRRTIYRSPVFTKIEKLFNLDLAEYNIGDRVSRSEIVDSNICKFFDSHFVYSAVSYNWVI